MAENIQKVLPEELKKFNWGAFFLTWIWGLGNKSYIALWALLSGIVSAIPVIGFAAIGFNIWLGLKGNEYAWHNKDWESVEQFNETQKKWVIAGAIVWVVLFVLGMLAGMMAGVAGR
ncbi:MAG: hypothetical protein K6C94_05490 [Candidatus Gastranaerophilales bacterium]|nr:hypothetical protein [Candidatus Gastranaerophilales bacterium]